MEVEWSGLRQRYIIKRRRTGMTESGCSQGLLLLVYLSYLRAAVQAVVANPENSESGITARLVWVAGSDSKKECLPQYFGI